MVIDTVELSKSARLARVDQACKSEYASQTVIQKTAYVNNLIFLFFF